ncbi:MAG: 3-oxoacyl-ACP synthase [Bacteroidota bacterium]|nr:3-oxoacyl-ACP synthase [Bacteroidota bacterium]
MKRELLKFCWDYVNERAHRLKKSNDDLQESLDSEDKNSTGDKHETGRAMVQLEQEKLAQQVQELDNTRDALKKVNIDRISETIGEGSWVKTSFANYFIAISAGAYKYEKEMVYCISINAPIAQLLVDKKKGDSFVFNGNTHTILEVV